MSNQRLIPSTYEYYHVYNRGVDKRVIFQNIQDLNRFIKSMVKFNTIKPVGSLFRLGKIDITDKPTEPLVEIVAFCLNPNHFHIILKQVVDGGISEFMKRLSGGYACYFNEKYERSGALFQGKYKSILIDSNTYLKHLTTYVNLNYKVHRLRGRTPYISSWDEYIGKSKNSICKKDIVLNQFKNADDYRSFANESLESILKRKDDLKDIEFEKTNLLAQIRKNYARNVKVNP